MLTHLVGAFSLQLLFAPSATGLIGDNLWLKGISYPPFGIKTTCSQKRKYFGVSSPGLLRLGLDEDELRYQEQDQHDYEDIQGLDDGEAENLRSQMKPHSQSPESTSEDYAQESLLQIYARDREWLAKATEVILDHNQYPLGQLTSEDVDKISVLMVSWVRQRSIRAALSVENLLKRVVDDMRAKNRQVHVNAKMYSLAMDAWAKSGAEGSAERAQHIHDAMVEVYKESNDLTMRPTTTTYNILVNAHGKENSPGGIGQAERVLQEMIHSGDDATKPDCITFNTLLDAYSKSKNRRNASERAPELLKVMEELGIERDSYTYTALQNTYATSDLPGAPSKCMEILETMISLHEKGCLLSKPACVNYNAVLSALSRTHKRSSAEMAFKIIGQMELDTSEGGYDVEPDRMSYALAILTCTRCPDEYGIRKAEEILLQMEARAREDETKRRAISCAAPASVVLDLECFNVVMTSLSKRRAPDGVERIITLLGRMKRYVQDGQTHMMPTVRSWNALLNAMARSKDRNAGGRAEQVLRHMLESTEQKVKPNAFSFTAVLTAYQKSLDASDAHRADELLREMESLYYEDGKLEAPPDVYHYTIVCNAWASSGLPTAARRVMQIVGHMNELAERGDTNAKPNARTYHALLDCLAKTGPEGEAERLLDHLCALEERGISCLDGFCFNSIIGTFCRSNKKGSGRRAEAVLDKMLEHSQLNKTCKASARTFTRVIHHYRKSSAPDAPYRAEYILNRMIALFKEGHHELEPDISSFATVMDAYSGAKHPDSGVTAERLLKQMKDLHSKHGATNLVVDSSVVYNVLFAWSVSGDDDAGRRAELHLDNMERKYEAGVNRLKPDIRSYGLVLNAWSKSNCFDKAQRALNILKRMEAQEQKGNTDVRPNEHCFSLVINACAFTNSGQEAEGQAFRIATSLLDKMLESEDRKPSSLTYGWFMQACGRLSVSPKQKEEQIERAWTLCCENGLVNAFVLHRFTGAAPEHLYKKLMRPVLSEHQCAYTTKEQLKFVVSPADLPEQWTKGWKRGNKRARQDWWDCK